MTSVELKKSLHNGGPVFGTLIVSPSPFWPKVLGDCGLDFVFIDTEHIALDRSQVSWMCRTYAAMGLPPLVRTVSPSPYEATMVLDDGAAGVVAPYIEQAEQVAAGHGDHDDHAEADEHGAGHDADAGHDHAAEHDQDAGHDNAAAHDAPDDGGHTHGAGHEHGTMVEAAAGETFLMTFTLPEDRRGEWATGCFLSGHYEAGMHGTLIVE